MSQAQGSMKSAVLEANILVHVLVVHYSQTNKQITNECIHIHYPLAA